MTLNAFQAVDSTQQNETSNATTDRPLLLEIKSHVSTPSYWVPETHRVVAIDPAHPAQPLKELRVELVKRRDDLEFVLILHTNNDSFSFVLEVVKQALGHQYLITGIIDDPQQLQIVLPVLVAEPLAA